MYRRASLRRDRLISHDDDINSPLLHRILGRSNQKTPTKCATLAGAACLIVTKFLVTTHPASAQVVDEPDPPPSIETRSPGDVDMGSGSYSMETVDLQIGSGPFPDGLTLERSYNSGSDRYFSSRSGYSSQGWSHNWVMHMTTSQMRNAVAESNTDPFSPGFTIDFEPDWYHSIVASNISAKFSNDQVVDFRYLPRPEPTPIPPELDTSKNPRL